MEQSVKNDYDALRVKDLLIDYNATELAEKLIALQDENDELAMEFDEVNAQLSFYEHASEDFGKLSSLAEAVSSSYFRAEVSSVVQVSPLEQIVTLSVDMTPGEALDVRSGHWVTLGLAPSQDFAALYQAV